MTAAGCLRLTSSERPDTDSHENSTESGSKSSDTEENDTAPPPHPCDGAMCLERPEWRTCVEGKLTIVSGEGFCALDSDSRPECKFDTEQVACPSGKCADAKYCSESPCHGVRCDSPLPNSCYGDTDEASTDTPRNQLIVHEREGRCQVSVDDNAPECVYDTAEKFDCPNGGGCDTDTRAGAHCAAEPCLGVVCNRPPARFCEDANTLVVWNLYGRCADDGSCVYDKRTVDCSSKGGCQNGRCASEPCAGMLCHRPPARYCASKETVVRFHHAGTCDETGGCVYREERSDCPDANCTGGNCGSQACFDGSEVNPPFLERTTCYSFPAPYCNTDGELVFWDNLNPCREGRCTYSTNAPPITCEGLCRDGRCTKDPCEGPTWECEYGKPAPYCADDAHVVVSRARACDPSDFCNYDAVTEPCPGGCQAGVCVEDSPAAAPQG